MRTGIWIARGLALAGFVDAAYLTATHYAGAAVFCGPSGGCETVLTSEYATLGPVPLALLGALYYATASLIAWTPPPWSRGVALALAGLTGVALAVSVALIWVQASLLEAWCRFCLASASITLLLFATALFLLRRVSQPSDGV